MSVSVFRVLGAMSTGVSGWAPLGARYERFPELEREPVAHSPNLERGLTLVIGPLQGPERSLDGAVVRGVESVGELAYRERFPGSEEKGLDPEDELVDPRRHDRLTP
jgi:hypothetical protein